MWMVAAYRRTQSPSRLAWSEGGSHLALSLYCQMNWVNSRNRFDRRDSAMKIVECRGIIIIIIIIWYRWTLSVKTMPKVV